jgi:DsbC/DsbD-like thiol-disulfide interchange protein
MITRFHAVWVGFVLTVAAAAGAAPPAPVETKHLTLAATPPAGPVAPGARVTLALDVTPKRTMHVYAPKAAAARTTATRGGTEGLIPVSLKIDADPAIAVGQVQFPKPELRDVLGESQLVYSAPFRIAQDVTLAATPALRARARTPGATVTVKGTLRYQACDDAICYVPVTVPVAWTVALEPPAR